MIMYKVLLPWDDIDCMCQEKKHEDSPEFRVTI